MRPSRRCLAGALGRAAVALATLAVSSGFPTGQAPLVQVAHAAVPLTWEYKSFTFAPFSDSELLNSGPALQQLADAGANTVTFVPTWYTSSEFVSDIFATGATASDASLVSAIQKARSLGLKVILKPHLDVQNGMWRAHINPPNPDTWFANYAGLINHYA